jgi:hypothetical protein
MQTNINELMVIYAAILAGTPFNDSAAYEVAKESTFNSGTIAHVRAINYDEIVAQNTTDYNTVTGGSPEWWSKYLC